MTNAEINLAIAKIEYPDAHIEINRDKAEIIRGDETAGYEALLKCYVTCWGDIMPIVERERMKIMPLMKKYRVSKGDVSVTDHALCRAAALCYLKLTQNYVN